MFYAVIMILFSLADNDYYFPGDGTVVRRQAANQLLKEAAPSLLFLKKEVGGPSRQGNSPREREVNLKHRGGCSTEQN